MHSLHFCSFHEDKKWYFLWIISDCFRVYINSEKERIDLVFFVCLVASSKTQTIQQTRIWSRIEIFKAWMTIVTKWNITVVIWSSKVLLVPNKFIQRLKYILHIYMYLVTHISFSNRIKSWLWYVLKEYEMLKAHDGFGCTCSFEHGKPLDHTMRTKIIKENYMKKKS